MIHRLSYNSTLHCLTIMNQPNILIFCFGMFFFGSVIATIGFFMDRKESSV
jgi:hypothetical protein